MNRIQYDQPACEDGLVRDGSFLNVASKGGRRGKQTGQNEYRRGHLTGACDGSENETSTLLLFGG